MSAASHSHAATWLAAQTVSLFFRHLDGRDYAAAAALFAQDGYWMRLGKRLEGPAAIEAALATRPAALATRHLVTNMICDFDGSDVIARYYITVFDDGGAADGPGRLDAPGAIFASEDRLVPAEQGWRFAARNPSLVFKKAA